MPFAARSSSHLLHWLLPIGAGAAIAAAIALTAADVGPGALVALLLAVVILGMWGGLFLHAVAAAPAIALADFFTIEPEGNLVPAGRLASAELALFAGAAALSVLLNRASVRATRRGEAAVRRWTALTDAIPVFITRNQTRTARSSIRTGPTCSTRASNASRPRASKRSSSTDDLPRLAAQSRTRGVGIDECSETLVSGATTARIAGITAPSHPSAWARPSSHGSEAPSMSTTSGRQTRSTP